MANFTAGTSFTDGVTNDVTALKLRDLVQDAVPTSNLALTSTTGTISLFSSGTGTAATPAIQPASDTNTGIFFPAADTIAFSEGGAEAMRIDSSGRVGIGTASPSALLHVSGSGATAVKINGGSNANEGSFALFQKGSTDRLFIGVASAVLGSGSTSNDSIVWTESTNNTLFYNNGTERLRIDSSGNVGIGTTSPINKLHLYNGTNSVGATQLELEGSYNAYGAGINFSSRTSDGGTLVTMAKITADGEDSWNTTGTTQDAGLRFSTTANGTLTERLRIDSSGNVGIGTNNPQNPLHVASSNAIIRLQDTDTVGNGTNSIATWITFRDSANTQTGYFGFPSDPNFYVWNITNSPMLFGTNNQERLRIDASGYVMVGKATTNFAQSGVLLSPAINEFTVSGGQVMSINRTTDDGALVVFYQAGTGEGNISVSGTTVSYNGGHLSRWSQLLNGQRDPAIKKGTVMSNLNEMCEWRDKDGNLLANEQLNKVKISDIEGDSNTAGVFVNWDNDDQDNPFDLNMAMTGDMIIRIAQGTIVNRGDLLMSAGDGTAKPQGDDIIRSKTIAKVTSTNVTCTYEDGSYCVPCVLMAC
jgi:hypothetical protein